MPENILRWVAVCVLILITLVFIHLGLAVLSGQTNTLFASFLDTTWPDAGASLSADIEPTSREELALSILNYGITALGTTWVACFAYLIVMRAQHRQAEQQLAIERLKLTTELDDQILEIFDSGAVYEIDGDGGFKLRKFITACDRNTLWRASTDRGWTYRDGERTVQFIETSTTVAPTAEIGLTALHRYLGWIRRIVRAIETGVLQERDVLLFWRWVVIGCYRNRYPFLCAVFFKDDLRDLVRLVDKIILTGEQADSGRDFLKYMQTVGDATLIAELSPKARALVEAGRQEAAA